MFFGVDAGGRLENGAVAGGLLQAAARYYYRQSPRRLLFMNLSAAAGANLDPDQQILLGGDSGLRGYPLRYQAGEGRWLFTAEQRLFSNWYPFQLFNVGGAVFYDMGATWGQRSARRTLTRPAARHRSWTSPRQQPLGTRQRAAHRYCLPARRRFERTQHPIPH